MTNSKGAETSKNGAGIKDQDLLIKIKGKAKPSTAEDLCVKSLEESLDNYAKQNLF